jgi:hypothetical protein
MLPVRQLTALIAHKAITVLEPPQKVNVRQEHIVQAKVELRLLL